MAQNDPYETLGVPRTASAAEIKKAFRRLARQHHPDVSSDAAAEAKFKAINEAYAILGDEQKRQAYDRFGPELEIHQSTGAQQAGFGDMPEELVEFMARFMRDAQAGRGSAPVTPHYEILLEISLDEVLSGAVRELELEGERIKLTIPAGAEDNRLIRFNDLGARHARIDAWIRRATHPVFTQRSDINLECELALSLGEALLGAEVPVTTLDGRVLLKVPSTTQSGRIFRLTGKGLPPFGGGSRGSLYVRVKVVLPTLDKNGRELAAALVAQVKQPDPRGDRTKKK